MHVQEAHNHGIQHTKSVWIAHNSFNILAYCLLHLIIVPLPSPLHLCTSSSPSPHRPLRCSNYIPCTTFATRPYDRTPATTTVAFIRLRRHDHRCNCSPTPMYHRSTFSEQPPSIGLPAVVGCAVLRPPHTPPCPPPPPTASELLPTAYAPLPQPTPSPPRLPATSSDEDVPGTPYDRRGAHRRGRSRDLARQIRRRPVFRTRGRVLFARSSCFFSPASPADAARLPSALPLQLRFLPTAGVPRAAQLPSPTVMQPPHSSAVLPTLCFSPHRCSTRKGLCWRR
jgi:hypothetical protein